MNLLSGQPNTSYRLDIVKELYIRYCMWSQYISYYHTIISYCKTSYYCILSMNKSRLEKPSILQEAVFIFVSPAPSTAIASEAHMAHPWVKNEFVDGSDQPDPLFISWYIHQYIIVVVSVSKSCLTVCDPRNWCPPGSSVHGIFQDYIWNSSRKKKKRNKQKRK